MAWLSQVTGETYRLLSEAGYEYATRAGTTAYSWGDDIKLNGQAMANCKGCGGKWDGRQSRDNHHFRAILGAFLERIARLERLLLGCAHTARMRHRPPRPPDDIVFSSIEHESQEEGKRPLVNELIESEHGKESPIKVGRKVR